GPSPKRSPSPKRLRSPPVPGMRRPAGRTGPEVAVCGPAAGREPGGSRPRTQDYEDTARDEEMANFTAADVKRLREQTAAGMLDCKRALEESDGDFDAAVEILRLKGAKDVSKRASRT